MKSAYEPFMSAIRDSYYNDYKQTCSIEEFVENCEVYSLQKDVFVSYIRSGVCERKIEVMMSEYDYENERMLESIYSSLRYIASEKKIVFVIGKLHMAPVCVLRFINRIFDRKDNMILLFAFEDARYYLESIIAYVNRIDSKASDDDRFKMLELMGQVYLGMGDCKDALLICEKMVPFFDNDGMHREYVYNMCSEKAKDEILQMNVDVVDTIAGFGSFKELFRCNFTYHVSKEIIERAQNACLF